MTAHTTDTTAAENVRQATVQRFLETLAGDSESGELVELRYRQPVVTALAKPPRESRDLVYARAVVTSPSARRVRLVFGYSDAVHIFLNGRLLFEEFQTQDGGYASRVYVIAERVEFLASRKASGGEASDEASPEQPATDGAAREAHQAA